MDSDNIISKHVVGRASLRPSGKRIHLVREETLVRSVGGEDPLEKEMATHSGILAWEIQ